MSINRQLVTRLLRRNALISLLGNGAGAALGLVTLALLARLMTRDEFGKWVLFLTVYTLFDTVRSGLILNGYIRHTAAFINDTVSFRRWTGAAWQLSLGLTLLASSVLILCVLFIPNANKPDHWAYPAGWFIALGLASLPASQSTWSWHAQSRFGPIQLIRPASLLIFLSLAVWRWWMGKEVDSSWLYQSYTIGNGLVSLVTLLSGASRIQDIFKATGEERHALLHFGKYTTGTMLLSNLLRSSDTLLIGAWLGPAAVVLYTIPQRLLELVEMPVRSVVVTSIPPLASLHQHQQTGAFTDYFHQQAGRLWFVLLPVSLISIILAEPLVTLLGGSDYSESATVLRFFMIYAAFLPLERFSGVGLDSLGRPDKNLIKVILMLTVNIIGDILALWLFESVAAVAFVSIATFMCGLVVGYQFMKPYSAVSLITAMRSGWQQGGHLINRVRHEFAR